MNSVSLTGKSGTVAFTPRARLMKLIGGELVSDEVVAITELVKNAYDADARTVTLKFKNVSSGNGEIIISDDGQGMGLQDVADYWMQPGGTTKSERKKQSRGGRRVLGEKGIGRFAVDKLGTGLVLATRKKGQQQEVLCTFDWREFEHDTRMLSDVRCAWEVRTSRADGEHGTELRITGLRTQWNERLFRKMCLRLGRLKTPFHASDRFKIVIESDDFPDYAGELTVNYLEQAPHRIEAAFDGDQTVVLTAATGATEELTWNGDGSLECGPVRVRLYGFDLETSSISKVGPGRDVRGWLREWTGVSIYRDGFRLSPYGEANDDWLRLDQRRVNNPMVCLSNNQVIGFVEIGRDRNPQLVDQTNREGMISNKAFADLRRLVLYVMQQLESARQRRRHPIQPGAKVRHDSAALQNSVAEELDGLASESSGVKPEKLRAISRRMRVNAERDRARFQLLADAYAELAAVGQVAEQTTRRAVVILDELEKHVAALSNGSKKTARILQARLGALRSEMEMLAPIQGVHGTNRRTIDLLHELKRARDGFQARLEERGVKVELPADNVGLVRVEMRAESFHRVLMMLFNNSMDWLHRTDKPKITITLEPDASDRHCALVFADNGPGIPASIAPRVFDPLESGREGARGMGLTIARDIMESIAGRIEIVQDRRRRGAAIQLLLPRKRTRVVRKR